MALVDLWPLTVTKYEHRTSNIRSDLVNNTMAESHWVSFDNFQDSETRSEFLDRLEWVLLAVQVTEYDHNLLMMSVSSPGALGADPGARSVAFEAPQFGHRGPGARSFSFEAPRFGSHLLLKPARERRQCQAWGTKCRF
jgi:hypothetical protein